MIELKVLGCSDTEKLKRIIISPSNGQFIFKEDKYLIGKCNQNDAEFDKLLFVRRDIKEISIPPKIKIIGLYSFDYKKIEEISIPPNIKIIGSYSFDYSKIEEISIPQSVTKICENAFRYCYEFQIIEISEKSQLRAISTSSFKDCQEFMIIMIPSSLKELIKKEI